MKKILVLILFLGILFAKSDVCKEYDGKSFILQTIEYNSKGDKIHTTKNSLDYIKIYFFKDRDSTHPITIEYSVNRHKRLYRYIFCMNENKKDTQWCGIDCDGGGFYANKNLDIFIKYPMRLFGGEDGEVVEINLIQIKDGYLKGREFKCPKELPKAKDLPDESYYKDNPNGSYVCYEYKEDNKYFGCFRTTKRCRDLYRQRFGKYGSKKAVKEALKRCQSSNPNLDYVDNPKGKYVCYDYIDDNGDYSGCFRAIKSCKMLNKKHFGHYPTIKESKKALFRCQTSTPKSR